MKENNSRQQRPKICIAKIRLPAAVQSEIAKGEREFKKNGRFKCISLGNPELRKLSDAQKVQHRRDSGLNAEAEAARGYRGQPPMVEQFRAVWIMVDYLESLGVQFGICPNSQINKVVRRLLNERAAQSDDNRKSRRKMITPEAVRALLRRIKGQRDVGTHMIKVGPYA
jgi:hypothetical protein